MSLDPNPARALMDRHAAATGLTSGVAPRRYLWTDAFAVCNWLGLGEVELARRLVDQVHRVLGRHRDDDPRDGWISGLSEEEGARRPTAGGLRIGKPLPERGPDEPDQPQLEGERDGQYFHYLTRWIRALQRMAAVTGEVRYQEWSVELARVAFEGFSHGIGPVPNRLYWKMSIDLSRPLVPSMGQQDALDGYVVMSEIRARTGTSALDEPMGVLAGMDEGGAWATEDPLGAGSLLTDAWSLARLPEGNGERSRILEQVIHDAAVSLRQVRDTRLLELPASQRLAFRELGLAIGLAAVARLGPRLETADLSGDARRQVAELRTSLPMRSTITEFWLDPANRRSATWLEHEDINTVMLATAVAPAGYLAVS